MASARRGPSPQGGSSRPWAGPTLGPVHARTPKSCLVLLCPATWAQSWAPAVLRFCPDQSRPPGLVMGLLGPPEPLCVLTHAALEARSLPILSPASLPPSSPSFGAHPTSWAQTSLCSFLTDRPPRLWTRSPEHPYLGMTLSSHFEHRSQDASVSRLVLAPAASERFAAPCSSWWRLTSSRFPWRLISQAWRACW